MINVKLVDGKVRDVEESLRFNYLGYEFAVHQAIDRPKGENVVTHIDSGKVVLRFIPVETKQQSIVHKLDALVDKVGRARFDSVLRAATPAPYRYDGRILIQAKSDAEALMEAQRSLSVGEAVKDKLERWNGAEYVKAP